MEYKRQTAAVHRLYEIEIEKRVSVSEEELRQAYRRSAVRFSVKQIFAKSAESAQKYYRELRSGVPFDSVVVQAENEGQMKAEDAYLDDVAWGDLDEALESVIFNLPLRQYSKPVKSYQGYHILMVTDLKKNIMLTESEFLRKRSSLRKKLKARKAASLANEYVKKLMEPSEVRIKANAFRAVTEALGLGSDQPKKTFFRRQKFLSDGELREAEERLTNQLDKPFMLSKREQWTIKDFLDILGQIPPEARPSVRSIAAFRDEIGILIRNRFLLKEAKKRGLDKGSAIDSTVAAFKGDYAYNFYLQEYFTYVPVPDEIKNYYAAKKAKKKITRLPPKSILPGMRREEDYRFYYAARKLHRDLISLFPDVAVRVNDDLLRCEAKRIDWQNPIRMFVVERQSSF